MEWIDAKKQLPNKSTPAIAYIKDVAAEMQHRYCYFISDLCWIQYDEENDGEWIYGLNDYLPNHWEVLYWMPQPPLPEGDKND